MLDHAEKWALVPDWQAAVIERPGLRISSLSGLPQILVSGNLDTCLSSLGISGTTGAWGVAGGETYAVRLAFDRMLVAGAGSLATGWHVDGYAVTDMSAGYHVFALEGAALPRLIARGTSIDLSNGGPSAALQFADMNALLYRHGGEAKARLHVNRAQAAALWTWFAAQSLD